MSFKLDPKSALLGAALVIAGGLAANQGPGLIQYVFKPGDPIRASEVNANFAALGTAVQNAQATAGASITADRLAVTAPGQPGQVLGLTASGLAWQTGTGAQGPAGPKGDTGGRGPQGETGPAGPKGEKGDTGAAGTTGPTGSAGPVGPKGDKGDTGAVGAQGPQGVQGIQGAVGPSGATGPTGPKGDTGAVGAPGPQGLPGLPSTIPGPPGPAGPPGQQGAPGPASTVPGPPGPMGPQGIPGPQGPQGPAGPGSNALGESPSPNGISGSGNGDGNCAVGEIRLTAANFAGAGSGAVPANGQLLQISQYQALYSLLGTTYGGDGMRTFALPDLRAAAPRSVVNGIPGPSVHYVICTQGLYPSRQ